MLHGYKGSLLHVDLTSEESRTIAVPEEVLTKYIGGRGLGAKLYWDLIPPAPIRLRRERADVLSGP